MRVHVIICLVLGSIGIPLFSQAPQDSKPSFEVASIKPNISGESGGGAGPRGDGFFVTNLTLRSLLHYADGPPNVGLVCRACPEAPSSRTLQYPAPLPQKMSSLRPLLY
jgi:hypothetical protein